MIKFFRRIRSKLIDEGNLKKYLLYAIGEILLVMIGILLALQVNNWNSNNKDRGTQNAYLIQLKKEAEIDLKRLTTQISNSQNYIQKVETKYLSKSQNPTSEVTKEDLDDVGIIRQTFFVNDDIYTEIISNGHLKLIPENIKSALMELHSLSEKINRIDDKSANNLNAQHLKMAEYFEVQRLSKTNQYEMILGNNSKEKEGLIVYKNYVNFSYDWMKTQMFFYGMLKKKYQNLINLIKENDLQQ